MIRKLRNDLTMLMVFYEYRKINVPMTAEDYTMSDQRAIDLYRNNPLFHATINHLVAHIFDLFLPHLKEY